MTGEWIALVIARWLNFIAVAGLFGMALFPLYAPRDARRAYLGHPATRAFTVIGGVLTFASTLGWAGAALVNIAGDAAALWDRDAWWNFLFDTSFGPAWLVRVVLAAFAIVVTGAARGRGGLIVVAALTAGLLVSQGWVGHVASLAAPVRLGVTLAYALHVLGAGAWFGGLLSLGVAMFGLGSPTESDRKTAEGLLVRFSSVGLAAVVAIIFGGALNVVAHGAWSSATLFASDWGRALAVKVALVGGMLVLACLNRFVLMPRLSTGDASAVPALARSVFLEQALGFAVLAATAALGVLDPSIS